MTDAAQLGRQLHAEMQRLWSKHDLTRHHSAALQGFYEDMSDVLLQAGRDQPTRQAGQEPAGQRHSSTVQVPDAADIYARRAAAMGRS
jgi:hypothetical protein